MSFVSKRQRRFLYKDKPEAAAKFEAKQPPPKVEKKSKQKRR